MGVDALERMLLRVAAAGGEKLPLFIYLFFLFLLRVEG